MSEPNSEELLWRLFDAACDGRLEADEVTQLQCLLEDPQVLDKYLNYQQLNADLQFRIRSERASRRGIALGIVDEGGTLLGDPAVAAPAAKEPSTPAPVLPAPVSPEGDHSLDGSPLGNPTVDQPPSGGVFMTWIRPWGAAAGLMAVVLLGLAISLAVGAAVFWGEFRGIQAPGGGNIPANLAAAHQESATFVARVTRASHDFQWASEPAMSDFLLRVPADCRLEVASGRLELEFRAGATLVVHGPAIFEAIGPSAGRLSLGTIACSTNLGGFQLQTPMASLGDADGEFVVSVDPRSGTEMAVLAGRLKVSPDDRVAEANTDPSHSAPVAHELKQGMAASVSPAGKIDFELAAADLKSLRALRNAPALWGPPENADSEYICLVDAISGGSGYGSHLAGTIDPSTGARDFFGAGRELKLSDRAFHEVGCCRLVDGVFVPADSGRSVEIDSLGTTIDLPASHGHSWGSLWAYHKNALRVQGDQRATLDPNQKRTHAEIVSTLHRARRGMIGMRANLGVTFDLRAARASTTSSVKQFRALVASVESPSDNSTAQPQTTSSRTMDVRVYVDGELRCERLGFSKKDGEAPIIAALSESDRFLTIVAMERGGMRFDQVMLVDPALGLAAPPKQVAMVR